MTGIEWLYTGGAILVGYLVIIVAMVMAAMLCAITDRITLPNWVHSIIKVIFVLLIILMSIVLAYGMGDLTIQRFMN